MKRYLLMLVLILGLAVSCMPKEVTIPNKNLKYEKGEITYKGKAYKGIVTYKGQPYTGKIKTNLKDKVGTGWEGFLTLKDGHLDGVTEIKNVSGEYAKFTVVDKNFDGDYIAQMDKMGEVHIVFKAGRPESTKIDLKFMGVEIKQNFIIDAEGKVNGDMTANGKSFVFKDGSADVDNMVMKLYLNEENKIVTEIYQGDKLIQKDVPKAAATPELYENLVFPAIINGEKMDMSLVF